MKVTPEIENLTEICKDHSSLDLSLYQKYDVKRGLRDVNGKGVLAGLTQISNVCAVKVVDGKEVPCAGSLSYRGYDIKELTRGFIEDDRYGFEDEFDMVGGTDFAEKSKENIELVKSCYFSVTIVVKSDGVSSSKAIRFFI